MSAPHTHFSAPARALHWTMAAAIVAMLFIGVGMVSTVSHAHNVLLAIHKPLGVALFILVLVRAGLRLAHGSPSLPDDMPRVQHVAARLSHLVLYALMFAMPLIGWSMLSAAGYPVTLYVPWHLPPIVPQSVQLYAALRALHTVLGLALFAVVLLHLAAALYHGVVRRDGVFSTMARGARRT